MDLRKLWIFWVVALLDVVVFLLEIYGFFLLEFALLFRCGNILDVSIIVLFWMLWQIQLILSLIQVFGGVERSWRWRSESSLAVGDLQGWRIDLEPRIPRWSAPSACFHKIDWMWIDYISVWGHVFVKIHCVYLLLKQKKITWVKTCFNLKHLNFTFRTLSSWL